MPKKGKIRSWNANNMKIAILAVREGKLGILAASKAYEVPHTTLQRMARSEKTLEELLSTKLGRRPILSKEIEKELVKYFLEMGSSDWSYTKSHARALAFQIAKLENIPNQFSILKERAGKDWLYGFLKRNKLELSKCAPLGKSRPSKTNSASSSNSSKKPVTASNEKELEPSTLQKQKERNTKNFLQPIVKEPTKRTCVATVKDPYWSENFSKFLSENPIATTSRGKISSANTPPALNVLRSYRDTTKSKTTVLSASPHKKQLENKVKTKRSNAKNFRKTNTQSIEKPTKVISAVTIELALKELLSDDSSLELMEPTSEGIVSSMDISTVKIEETSGVSAIKTEPDFVVDSGNPTENSVCFYCKKFWKEENKKIPWSQCVLCDMVWAHNSCMPNTSPIFICESCNSYAK